MPHNRIRIKDHALMRYFQRVKSQNLDAARKDIIARALGHRTKHVPDGAYPIDNCEVIVKNNVVITIRRKAK